MVVGVGVWELLLPGCQTLKDKRRIVASLKARLHHQFNVSAAETNYQDLVQRAEIAVCVVSNDRRHAHAVLLSADRLVADCGEARVLEHRTVFY